MLSKTTIWPAAVLALFISLNVQAAPYGFKGIELGSHLSQIASNPKFDCRAVTTPSADRVCGLRKDETETIAGIHVDSLFYFFDQSSLSGISISLDEKHYEAVVKALKDKFGTPQRSTETVKTLSGQSHENIVYRWHQPDQSIIAQRYAGRVDKSSVRILDDSTPQRIKQRREQIARQPHTDL